MSFRCHLLTAAERARPGGLPYGVSLALCSAHAVPGPEPRRRPHRAGAARARRWAAARPARVQDAGAPAAAALP